MNNNVILDSSALLALLKNEPGSDIVESLLGNIIMSSINVTEVATVLLDSEMTLQECQDTVLPFISNIKPYDEVLAFLTADLRKQTKAYGLSLGDRACIALGQKMQLPIYTADKIWGELQLENVKIKLIR
ncbi:MAG: type II toxin-antitoxin system VapC family toxin [Candidatus Paracaedimonas acanthamoebae]|uniref:Type II toxin-antitoxin system VapC family toxin n=1 Tax=Candidatus Paracaedimonas acanthamoebae TaxID=244581 RepID=A0A8J7TU22_9PROT|nr:type II toxin-antitoxin system VapC family toxin [Holosporales bacterium]MBN9412296.1 type II toxin-antitoxin system VapC family toxin [Candidatus Paracaedimonas acanthamoebae]